jgi:hypothetical protein
MVQRQLLASDERKRAGSLRQGQSDHRLRIAVIQLQRGERSCCGEGNTYKVRTSFTVLKTIR